MSNNAEHQSRLSLPLRKRHQERPDVSLVNKRQAKNTTEGKQLRQDLPAFGAPIEEEKKTTKRNAIDKPSTTEKAPTKKRKTRQTDIKEILKMSSTAATSSSASSLTTTQPSDLTEADSKSTKPITTKKAPEQHEALNTEVANTHAIFSTTSLTEMTEVGKTIEQSEFLPTENSKTHTTTSKTPTKTTVTTETEASAISCKEIVTEESPVASALHSPSRSPTLEHSPTEKRDSLLEDSSLPSPVTTPKTTRTAKMITANTTPLSPCTMSKSSSPKSQVTVATSPSASTTTLCDKSLSPKERIAEERSTLDKLVSALDITLTFHAARNITAFFHKIQPMLRNSTRKNITISHLCKVLFVAPELYDVQTKLMKEYGKEVEAHQVSIGHDWKMPLSGKAIQERKDLMRKRSGNYYEEHKEVSATIPEMELPRLDKVVDKKKWLEQAKLPDRVRSFLKEQEQRKAAKEEKASQPRTEPKGTAKDRAKALLDRIRNKQKK